MDFFPCEVLPVTVQTSQHLPLVLEVFRTLEKKTERGVIEQKLYEHACAHLATLMTFVMSVDVPLAQLQEDARGELFIVGKTTSECGSIWEFQGVFDTKQKAVAACRDARYFVAPATLNLASPDEKTVWAGAFNPIRNL